MIEKLLASSFTTKIDNIETCFKNCGLLLDYNIKNKDKIMITNLIYSVNDKIDYDYPLQKLQIYTIIVFSNFLTEGVYLELDEKYTNTLIDVILKTDIISKLFKLL